jgi:hypothetical protein
MVASRAFARCRRDVLLSVERGSRYVTACHPSGNPAKQEIDLPIAQSTPIEHADCATDRFAEAVDLHLASQAALLSITSGTWNPAMGCFGLVLGICPL